MSDGLHIEALEDGLGLLSLTRRVSADELCAVLPRSRTIYALDFYVDGAEGWARHPYGWSTTTEDGVRLVNIDHHAPDPAYFRSISSGILAMRFLEARGPVRVDSDIAVVINHCDNDSVLSALLLTGEVGASDDLVEAILAMDHTGAAHAVGDAVQALESLRDLRLSLDTARAAVGGAPLPERAQGPIAARTEERQRLATWIGAGDVVRWAGRVAWLEAPQRIAAEMLPALLPDAVAIVAAQPGAEDRWLMKLRLGPAAAPGVTLFDLDIPAFDPGFGGRWNAGSNKRGGGTALSPAEYSARLDAAYDAAGAK